MKTGKVVKSVGGVFYVFCDGRRMRLFSRKKIRLRDEVFVGDNVLFDEKERTIEKVLPRTNRLVRPPVANVDCALIFVAPSPEPDLFLADKILLNCFRQDVSPLFVVNKKDISDDAFCDRIKSNYSSEATVFCVSALRGEGVEALKRALAGKTVCLTGQSAVGKTTLLNLLTRENMPTGDLSEKISRGKNTTRHSEIFGAGQDTFLIDTPGFSLLDTQEIRAFELGLFYPDFAEQAPLCRFNMCTHTAEPDCAVKSAVTNGRINGERYERYVANFEQLKKAEEERF